MWSWSHTNEAYHNAERNLHGLGIRTLQVIWAEWKASLPTEDEEGQVETGFDQKAYDKALKESRKLPADVLADSIWEQASSRATCDNGGFNASMCPFDCDCHTVPFDLDAGGRKYLNR